MKKFLIGIMVALLFFTASSPPSHAKSITTSAPQAFPGFDQAVVTVDHAVPAAASLVLAVPWRNQLQLNYFAPLPLLLNAESIAFNYPGTMIASSNTPHLEASAGKHITLPDIVRNQPATSDTDMPDYIQKE
jgi:hypothetical protein